MGHKPPKLLTRLVPAERAHVRHAPPTAHRTGQGGTMATILDETSNPILDSSGNSILDN